MVYLTSDLYLGSNNTEEVLFQFDNLPLECCVFIVGGMFDDISINKKIYYINRLKKIDMEIRANRTICLFDPNYVENLNLGFSRVFEFPIIYNNVIISLEEIKSDLKNYNRNNLSWDTNHHFFDL